MALALDATTKATMYVVTTVLDMVNHASRMGHGAWQELGLPTCNDTEHIGMIPYTLAYT